MMARIADWESLQSRSDHHFRVARSFSEFGCIKGVAPLSTLDKLPKRPNCGGFYVRVLYNDEWVHLPRKWIRGQHSEREKLAFEDESDLIDRVRCFSGRKDVVAFDWTGDSVASIRLDDITDCPGLPPYKGLWIRTDVYDSLGLMR
jgi:hypothetical protein